MWSPGLRGRSVHSKEGGGGSRTDQVPPSASASEVGQILPQISEGVNALPAPVHFPPATPPRRSIRSSTRPAPLPCSPRDTPSAHRPAKPQALQPVSRVLSIG